MNGQKFSLSDCIRFGAVSVVDNFRLFFLSNLVIFSLMLVIIGTTIIINMSFIGDAFALTKRLPAQQLAVVESATQSTEPTASISSEVMLNCKGKSCAIKQLIVGLVPVVKQHWVVLLISVLLMMFLVLGFGLGYAKLLLDFHDTGSAKISTIFSEMFRAPKVFIAGIIYCMMLCIGFALFIIPGIVVLVRGSFFMFAIADKNMGPVAALSRSFAITRGYTWHLVSLMLVVIALGSMSSVMLLAFPIVAMMRASVYRKLSSIQPA